MLVIDVPAVVVLELNRVLNVLELGRDELFDGEVVIGADDVLLVGTKEVVALRLVLKVEALVADERLETDAVIELDVDEAVKDEPAAVEVVFDATTVLAELGLGAALMVEFAADVEPTLVEDGNVEVEELEATFVETAEFDGVGPPEVEDEFLAEKVELESGPVAEDTETVVGILVAVDDEELDELMDETLEISELERIVEDDRTDDEEDSDTEELEIEVKVELVTEVTDELGEVALDVSGGSSVYPLVLKELGLDVGEVVDGVLETDDDGVVDELTVVELADDMLDNDEERAVNAAVDVVIEEVLEEVDRIVLLGGMVDTALDVTDADEGGLTDEVCESIITVTLSAVFPL